MIPITVMIQYARGGNKGSSRVKLDLDGTVDEAIEFLTKELSLDDESEYQLVRQRQGLSGSDKLYEAGVQENDILQLVAFDSNATMMGRGLSAKILNRMGGKSTFDPLPESIHASLVAAGGQSFQLRHTRAVIGRADASLGYPPESLDADLTTLDPTRTVSRPHALIVYSADEFTIRDLYSQTGVVVNGRRIPANTAFPLQDNDLLQIGNVVLKFHVE